MISREEHLRLFEKSRQEIVYVYVLLILFLQKCALIALHLWQGRPAVRTGRLDALAPTFLHPKMQTKRMVTMAAHERRTGGVVHILALNQIQTHRTFLLLSVRLFLLYLFAKTIVDNAITAVIMA